MMNVEQQHSHVTSITLVVRAGRIRIWPIGKKGGTRVVCSTRRQAASARRQTTTLYHVQLQTQTHTTKLLNAFCLIVSEHEFFMIAISFLVIVILSIALCTLCLPPFSQCWVSRWCSFQAMK